MPTSSSTDDVIGENVYLLTVSSYPEFFIQKINKNKCINRTSFYERVITNSVFNMKKYSKVEVSNYVKK